MATTAVQGHAHKPGARRVRTGSAMRAKNMEPIGCLRLGRDDVRVAQRPVCVADCALDGSPSPAEHRMTICLLAAGPRAIREAARLAGYCQARLDGECNVELISLAPADRTTAAPEEGIATRVRISERLTRADFTILIAQGGQPWDRLASGDDPLLSLVRSRTLLHLDIDRDEAEIARAVSTARCWRPSATVTADSLRVKSAAPGTRTLTGVAEAVLSSVVLSGLICVDYADYLNAFGDDGPMILRAGFGTGDGPDRHKQALEAALHRLERNGGLTDVHSAMAAAGLPIDGHISEVEAIWNRFADRISPDRSAKLMVSAPVASETSFEVALVTATKA